MDKPARSQITGLILAGGAGARMAGADKGLVVFDGRPLVEHVLLRLRPQVGHLLISANRNLERYREFGIPVVSDAAPPEDGGAGSRTQAPSAVHAGPLAGPLAGVLAGMRAMTTPWLACVPCDAPLVPRDLVELLAAGAAIARPSARAAVAVARGRVQPVFCLLHAVLADDLRSTLGRGERRAEEWLRAIDAVAVEFADDTGFANFNTPDDLHRHGGRTVA